MLEEHIKNKNYPVLTLPWLVQHGMAVNTTFYSSESNVNVTR